MQATNAVMQTGGNPVSSTIGEKMDAVHEFIANTGPLADVQAVLTGIHSAFTAVLMFLGMPEGVAVAGAAIGIFLFPMIMGGIAIELWEAQ